MLSGLALRVEASSDSSALQLVSGHIALTDGECHVRRRRMKPRVDLPWDLSGQSADGRFRSDADRKY
jgi:hypothetical protein